MYKKIADLLSKHKLKNALSELSAYAEQTNNWQIKSETDALRTTYEYMLQYAAQGVDDPSRKDLYRQVYSSALSANEKLKLSEDLNNGSSFVSSKFRLFKQHPARSFYDIRSILESYTDDMNSVNTDNELSDIPTRTAIQKRHQSATDELFYKVMVPSLWSKEDYSQALEIINSELVIENVKSVMISAAGISLLYFVDPLKLRLLYHVYSHFSNPPLSQRALVGIVLCIYFMEDKIKSYNPELIDEFGQLDEIKNFRKDLSTILMQLLIARGTEEVDKKMREEIIPSIMNNAHIEKSDKTIREISLEDMIEFNPEWEKSMDKIKDQIKQLYDMKTEGADTYMYAFSSMKIFSFFNEPAHWFYKFGTHVPEIYSTMNKTLKDKTSPMMFIMNSTDMCDSDKFSLCLTFKDMPDFSEGMLNMKGKEQSDVLKEQMKAIEEDKDKNASESRMFIQDYYRFCKLCSAANERIDIFKDKFKLWNSPTLSAYLKDGNTYKTVADYLLSKEHYDCAAEIYRIITSENPVYAEAFQKLGYTYIKMGKYDLALEALNTANILNPEDSWTLKNIALCYRKNGMYEKAMEWLYEAEKQNPDNLNICLQLGQVLTYIGRFDEALKFLFKVEYLGKGKTSAQRNIAWCYFMIEKPDEAINMYNKIIEKQEAKAEDFMNLGHVYLTMNNISEALKFYKEAESLTSGNDVFISMLDNDKDLLLNKGVQEEILYIIPDMIDDLSYNK